MKSLLLNITALYLAFSYGLANAQLNVDLFIENEDGNTGTFEDGISLSSEFTVSAVVSNFGSVESGLVVLKLWVSIDDDYSEEDLPIETTPRVLAPLALGVCPSSECGDYLMRGVSLTGSSNSDYPRLIGDDRSPSEWINQAFYIRACTSEGGGPFTNCIEREVDVFPPAYRASDTQAVPIEESNSVELSWPPLPLDNGVRLFDYFLIDQNRLSSVAPLNPLLDDRDIRIDIDDLETNANGDYRFVAEVDPGVDYLFFIQACTFTLGCLAGGGEVIDFVHVQANFSASVGTIEDGIQVDWVEFRSGTDGYDLVRCREDDPSDCVLIWVLGNVTSYIDRSVLPRVSYIYTIYECSQALEPTRCRLPISDDKRTGVTNAGRTGLRDRYEDDDTPQQATTVSNSVSQLRSFDTPTDEDWLEIVVSSAQSITFRTSGETSEDTQLTLFDETGTNQIDFSSNTPGVPTSFATLITEELEPGVYFLKVNQGFIPGLPPQEVFNYTLEIEMNDTQVIMAPILQLLLND